MLSNNKSTAGQSIFCSKVGCLLISIMILILISVTILSLAGQMAFGGKLGDDTSGRSEASSPISLRESRFMKAFEDMLPEDGENCTLTYEAVQPSLKGKNI